MNSEPPIGDNLQQMLVTMKRNVLTRLDDKPGRTSIRRRVGIVAAIVALVGVGTASGAVALGMVPAPFVASHAAATRTATPSGSASPLQPTPTPTPTPTSTATQAQVTATIPTTCSNAVPASDYSRLFGSLVLKQYRPVVSGTPESYYIAPDETQYANDASLACMWNTSGGTEDNDNLFLQVGTVNQSILTTRLQTLSAKGWTCTDRLEGRACQHSMSTTYYNEPIDTTFTFFVRGNTWIEIGQSNIATNGLLNSLVQQIWK